MTARLVSQKKPETISKNSPARPVQPPPIRAGAHPKTGVPGIGRHSHVYCSRRHKWGTSPHFNYTRKPVKCKETYAFFITLVQNMYFIFMISHKVSRRYPTNSTRISERMLSDPEKRVSAAPKKCFPQFLPIWGNFVESAPADGTSAAAKFSTVWKSLSAPSADGFHKAVRRSFHLAENGVRSFCGENKNRRSIRTGRFACSFRHRVCRFVLQIKPA